MGRAGPVRLVAGHCQRRQSRVRPGGSTRSQLDRTVRADAQLRPARRIRPCAAARDTLERRPHHRLVPLHNRNGRHRWPEPTGGQSRPRRLHRAQVPLDARRGARPVRPAPHATVAQGLREVAHDRLEGHRAFRRRWHTAVRRTTGTLVRRDGLCSATRRLDTTVRARLGKRHWRTRRVRRRVPRAEAGHASGRRRRGQRRGRSRLWRSRAGRIADLYRHLRRGSRPHPSAQR